MKLLTYAGADGVAKAGLLLGDEVLDLSAVGYGSVEEIIAAGEIGLDALRQAGKSASQRVPLQDVTVLAPLRPSRVFAIGLNYHDHAKETGMTPPKVPVVFFKLRSSVIGHGAEIRLPKASQQVDWEAEFGVVIGKGGKKIRKEDWKDHVFGYTIINDVSARDVQFSTSQWTMAKSFDTFCPMGPVILTADEIADPSNVDIRLEIDGQEMQRSNTKELIFSIPELIEYLSSIAALEPGDVISTGTPAGVGMGMKPQRWLKAGETVSVFVDGIGVLTNPVADEA